MTNGKSKVIGVMVAGFIILIGIGYGGYKLWKDKPLSPRQNYATQSANQNTEPEKKTYITTRPSNGEYRLLSDSLYNFTLEYPKEWVVTESTIVPTDASEWTHALSFGLPTDEYGNNPQVAYVFVWENPEHLPLVDWYKKYDIEHTVNFFTAPDAINSRIAEEEAIFYLYPAQQSTPTVLAYLMHENRVFEFQYSAANNGADYQSFIHMLETFEFGGRKTEDEIPIIDPEDLKFKE